MIDSISDLLGMLPVAEEGTMYAEELDGVMQGDLQALPSIARRIEFGIGLECKPKLAEQVYDWCVATHNCLDWQLREWHRSGEQPWSASEVKELLFRCEKTNVFAFSVLVEAIVSDGELLHRFKKQALQAYQRLAKQVSPFHEVLQLWHARLLLDPRMKPSEEVVDEYMDVLEEHIHMDTDPTLALFFLEKAVRMKQADLGTFDLKGALSAVKCSRAPEAYAFYKGLVALCEGRYQEAYPAFASAEDARCRLSQAYCLIHGLGVPVDHDAARAILKAFPNDGFALFLLAVSLYRTRGGDGVPDEVIELLDESYRLGYRPAKVTKFSMVFRTTIAVQKEAEKRVACWDRLSNIADDERNGMAYGFYQFGMLQKSFARLQSKVSALGDFSRAQEAIAADEEVQLWGGDIMDVDDIVCSALGCYSRAFYEEHIIGESESHYWEEGLKRFNQSAAARRWALCIALVDTVFGNFLNDMEFLLSLYRSFGASDEELLAWYMVISLNESVLNLETRAHLARAVVEMFRSDGASPLEKALLACLCCNDMFDSKDLALTEQALRETADVEDVLIQELRHKAMLSADLDGDHIGSTLLECRMVGDADWLDQFIGYSFFDYNE